MSVDSRRKRPKMAGTRGRLSPAPCAPGVQRPSHFRPFSPVTGPGGGGPGGGGNRSHPENGASHRVFPGRSRKSGAGAQGRLGTLWDQKQCTQVCSKEELWEAAKEEEMRIPWKEGSEESSVSNCREIVTFLWTCATPTLCVWASFASLRVNSISSVCQPRGGPQPY